MTSKLSTDSVDNSLDNLFNLLFRITSAPSVPNWSNFNQLQLNYIKQYLMMHWSIVLWGFVVKWQQSFRRSTFVHNKTRPPTTECQFYAIASSRFFYFFAYGSVQSPR